jgi:hypothetical protein
VAAARQKNYVVEVDVAVPAGPIPPFARKDFSTKVQSLCESDIFSWHACYFLSFFPCYFENRTERR